MVTLQQLLDAGQQLDKLSARLDVTKREQDRLLGRLAPTSATRTPAPLADSEKRLRESFAKLLGVDENSQAVEMAIRGL